MLVDEQTAVGDKTGAQVLRLREARYRAAQLRCGVISVR